MIPLLVLHLVACIGCLAPGRRSARWALPLSALVAAVTFAWLIAQAPDVLAGSPLEATLPWVPQLGASITLRLDGFGLFMGLLVSGIGSLVLLYSISYFGCRDDLGRVAGLLIGFAGSMLGLVWADGLLTLFVFWELTSITSFLLIGFDDTSATARAAASRAFLVTGGGGLALLVGLILLGQQGGTSTISGLLSDPPSGTVVSVALVLVLLGAFTKSAQVPFHFWLPGAMAAPTPISAYLHSATMVKAGIVVVARFAPVFAPVGPWRGLVVAAGLASLLLGGFRAMRQQDAKLALAHSTVSQLGLLMVLFGLGTPATTYAGVAMLLAHALFKASLFLSVGVIDHSAGTRDMRRLHKLMGRVPLVAASVIVAGASMAAIPPTLGFAAKEKALDGLVDADIGALGTIALLGVVVGSALTVAYSIRLVIGLLGDDAPGTTNHPAVEPETIHRPSGPFLVGGGVLAALSLVFGLAAAPVGDWLGKVAGSLDPASATKHLTLFAGINEAFLLSMVVLVGGTTAWWFTRSATRTVDAPTSRATITYDKTYDGLLTCSRRITASTQSGSLPLYVGVVLGTLAVGLIAALVVDRGDSLAGHPFTNSAAELVACTIAAAVSVAVLLARQRFTAAVLLGASGYVLALIFLIQGAPDLAVTQFLVETLTIVVFLLVLSRLPRRFSPGPAWAPFGVRVAISVTVGIVVALFALSVSTQRTEPSVGDDYIARSEPEGGGRNVVNVILVDFRGFDTMGEITVLAVAGAGVINLVAAARREQRRKHLRDATNRVSDQDDLDDQSGLPEDIWR